MVFSPIASYIEVLLTSIAVNVVPALAPPTWLVLSLFKINRPEFNLILLALVGVIGSVIGRYVMYKYSQYFGKYVPKKEAENLHYFRKFIGETKPRVFIETFLFSLSPLPSNFLFISFGLSGVDLEPVLIGFFLGRLLSYSLLIYASFRFFTYFSIFVSASQLRIAVDILGALFAVAIIFIRWKNIYFKAHEWRRKLEKFF